MLVTATTLSRGVLKRLRKPLERRDYSVASRAKLSLLCVTNVTVRKNGSSRLWRLKAQSVTLPKLPESLVRRSIAGELRIESLPRVGMRHTSKLLMRLKARYIKRHWAATL